MKVTQVLKMEVLAVLSQMAVDGDLDGDISGLDIDEVFDKAVKRIEGTSDTFTTQMHFVEILEGFISGGESPRQCFKDLQKAKADGNGNDPASYHIGMAELYEDTFSVNQLLQEIGV